MSKVHSGCEKYKFNFSFNISTQSDTTTKDLRTQVR